MTEIKYLLDKALDGAATAPIDPAADLARGRARLHRTRRNRVSLIGGACAIAVLLPVGLAARNTPVPIPVPAPTPGVVARPSAGPLSGIALVAYTGEQPPGYAVREVPAGWEIQGGNEFALVIAPKGFADQQTDSFEGKLVVMLASRDETVPGPGTPQQVDGRPGVVDTQGDTQLLRYQGADGRWVVVQAPAVLGWNAARLAQFGAGVTVLGNADSGRG